MTTTKELAEWLESLSKNESHTRNNREMFAAADRRLAVLEEEVEAGRKLDAMRAYYLAIKDFKVAESGPYEIQPLMDALAAARAATDKERANG